MYGIGPLQPEHMNNKDQMKIQINENAIINHNTKILIITIAIRVL